MGRRVRAARERERGWGESRAHERERASEDRARRLFQSFYRPAVFLTRETLQKFILHHRARKPLDRSLRDDVSRSEFRTHPDVLARALRGIRETVENERNVGLDDAFALLR